MYDEILVPTDGNLGAAVALDHALALADQFGATVHLVTAVETADNVALRVLDDAVDVLLDEGERVVELAADRARIGDRRVVTSVLEGEPAAEIVAYAERSGIDLVLLPTRGRRGLHRRLLGSVTDRVVRTSPVPVLTVRPGHEDRLRFPYRAVLAPTDGSRCASAAVAEAARVAAATDAALRLLAVSDTASLGVDLRSALEVDVLEDRARSVLDEALDLARATADAPVTGTTEFGTSAAGTILDAVGDHDADLVVMGTHGRTGADRFLLGSVAERILRAAPVPVMTVRVDADG